MVKSTKIADNIDEELRQSSEMLSTIFDLNPDAIVLTRVSDGEIIDCNQEYLNQIGYSREDVIGHTSLELNLYSSKERQAYVDKIQERNTITNFELRVKRKNNVFINVLYSARLITINDEKILLNICKDITERKNTEKQIEYHALLLSKVNDAVIGTDSNFNITYWNQGAEQMYGYTESEAIGKFSVELLRPTYAPGERERIIKELNDKGNSLTIIKTKDRIGIEIIVEVNSTRIIDEYGNISGYVVVYRNISKQKKDEMQRQDLLEKEQMLTEELQSSNEELQSVTEELQVSNEELQQQRNELSHINQSLLESEKRMNISQEIANLGSWELDIKNNCLSWSDEVYRIFGLRPQEFDATYEAFLDNVHPDDRAAVDEAYSGSIREGRDTYEIEHRIVRKNGEVRIVHEKCEHFRDDSNTIVRSVGMVHDITERKQTEKALVESEAKYHSLYSSMSEGVAIHEIIYNYNREPVDYIITDVNRAYEEITGLKKSDVEGKKASELYGTGNPPYIEIYSRVAGNGKPAHFETYFEPMDKYFRVDVISHEKGRFATFFEDISERKNAEEELRENKSTLDEAQQIAHIGSWDWNSKTGDLRRSDEFFRILGIEPQPCENPVFSFLNYVHPEDREMVKKEMDRTLDEGKPHNFEARIVQPDGSIRGVHEQTGIIECDVSGKPLRVIGTMQDITEQKRIEEALSESEERFRALADNIPNLAWMADANGWIFWYNKQWYEYTGTTLEEMQGWGWQKVHHPDYVDSITEEWSTKLLNEEPYDNIFPLKGKNGNYRWFLTRVTPIRDDQGKLIQWFGTNTDITDRKLYEENLNTTMDKLEQSNKELEQFAYVASHDLREPLRMITSFLQLLERRYKDQLDQNANEFIGFAVEGAKRMDMMINDLLQLFSNRKSRKRI